MEKFKQKVKNIVIQVGLGIWFFVIIVGGFIAALVSGNSSTSASTYSSSYSYYSDSDSDGGTYQGDTYTYQGHTYKLYKQGNYNDYFGGKNKTIATSGCGAVSVSICLSGYGIDADPSEATKRCAGKYGYTYNAGVIPQWLKEYGVSSTYYDWGSNSLQIIKDHIKNGNPVIFNIGARRKIVSFR